MNPKNVQRAAPARCEMSQITAASPHQRGQSRTKQIAVQVVDTILCFPKAGNPFVAVDLESSCKRLQAPRVSCNTELNSQADTK